MYKKVKGFAVISLTIVFIMTFITGVFSSPETYAQSQSGKPAAKNTSKTVKAPVIQGYEKVAENDKLSLFLDRNTLALKIYNKSTGYVWDSTLVKKDPEMNSDWQNFSGAGLTVEYRDDTNKVSQISSLSDSADIKVSMETAGFSSDVIFGSLGFELKFEVKLSGDEVSVNIPYSSIKELNNNYKLEKIYIYPFLGSSYKQEGKGYIFLPDGSGALMYTNQKTAATQPYTARVYGEDRGFTNLEQVAAQSGFGLETDPMNVNMPVFGVTQTTNKDAFVAVIDKGAEYSEIDAYPAGVTTDYNWVTSKFIYRQSYQQPVDKKGNGIIMNQKNKNAFDISIKYIFLSGNDANYSGMALKYQNYLVKNGMLVKRSRNSGDIPLHVEFLAADSKKQLIGRQTVYMTKLKDVENIIGDMLKNGVKRLNIEINGYTKNGVTNSNPGHFPFDSRIGSEKEWTNLVKKYNPDSVMISFYTNYVRAYGDGKGYSQRDMAQSISEQLIGNAQYIVYLNAAASKRIFEAQIDRFRQINGGNLTMGSIGSALNSNYGKTVLTRLDSEKQYKSLFGNNKTGRIGLSNPNAYMWKYAGDIYNIPMDSSKYVLTQESVPFMQIVLKGYVDYYAPESNFNANPKLDILRAVDYGAYPSYILTKEDPVKLIDTGSNWIYTSQYSVWKDQIIKEYKTVNSVLKKVEGATIKSRETVSKGIVKVSYSNGINIYINYTAQGFKNGEVNLPALNCVAVRGK